MTRIELLLALLGLSLCAASMAAEPGLCKSMCTGEKRECRAKAKAETDLDREPLFDSYDKNPFSRANSQGQVATDRMPEAMVWPRVKAVATTRAL